MKKIYRYVLGAITLFATTGASAQDYARLPKQYRYPIKTNRIKNLMERSSGMLAISVGNRRAGFTLIAALPIRPKVGILFGTNIGYFTAGTGRESIYSNSKFIEPFYAGFYTGSVFFTKKVQIGIAIEAQSVTKPGDTKAWDDIWGLAGRFYAKGTWLKADFLLSCQLGGRLADYFGYVTYPNGKKLDAGIYYNRFSSGAGFLMKFSVGKKRTTRLAESGMEDRHLVGGSAGYNSISNNISGSLIISGNYLRQAQPKE